MPILFFSGGKDSTFIASRLVANKIKALYFCFAPDLYTKNIVTELSEKMKIKVYFSGEKLKHLDLQKILLNVKEPILDPAGISVLLMLDLCLNLNYKFSEVLFLDGMGNDMYMGHIPAKRDLQKRIFFKKFHSKSNYINSFRQIL